MSRLDPIRRMFAHMRWADDRALASLRDQPGELVSRALSIYAHVLGAEHVWLSRLRQEPTTVPVWPEFTIDECARSDEESHARYQAYLASLADRHFTIVKDTSGETARTTVTELRKQEVVGELVRMLGADREDAAARRHAKELLKAA